MVIRVLVTILVAALSFACGRVAPAGEGGGAALMRNALRARQLEIVAEERELHDALERAAARLRAADEFERFDAVVTEGHPSLGRATPRIVVGTRKSPRVWQLATHAGVAVDRDAAAAQFGFGGETYADPGDAVIATFEDPERPGLPVTVVLANATGTAAALCAHLQPAWKPSLRVLHGLQVVREEALHADGTARPFGSISGVRARAARGIDLAPMPTSIPGIELRAASGIAPDTLARYVSACGGALERAGAWIGAAPAQNVSLCVWSQALDYVIDGDAHALSRCDPILRRTDALLLGACDDGGAGVVRARAWIALGPPAEPWMADAAGVEAAWSWWGRELDPWLARIVRRGETPLGELVAAAATGRISTHVISPLRGAYWRHLRETRGDEFVRGLWRGTRVLETGPVEHAAFTTWLAARTAAARIEHEGRREAARARDRDFKLLRGVAFSEFDDAHARIDARSSPGRILEPALDEAKQLGADAVLVTAHAVDRPGLEARFGDAPPSLVEPREGDVRVAAALLAASKRGMRTCLSANLLAGSGGTWSGTWTRGPESDWAGFFDRYSRFVEHHGALAELTGTTILSLGTALPDVATLAPPGRRPNHLDAGYKQAGWTRVIAVARRSFSGLLTYTAGSPAELDGVPFLADLDFVSLDMSPTLELDDPADGTEARYEITHLMDVSLLALEKKARETKKRILFTQVCFSPALEGAARRFGVEHASVDWQAQQFLDFSERLRTWSGLPLVAGVFAWRLGTGAAEPDYAPVLDSTRVREAVRTLYQGLPR